MSSVEVETDESDECQKACLEKILEKRKRLERESVKKIRSGRDLCAPRVVCPWQPNKNGSQTNNDNCAPTPQTNNNNSKQTPLQNGNSRPSQTIPPQEQQTSTPDQRMSKQPPQQLPGVQFPPDMNVTFHSECLNMLLAGQNAGPGTGAPGGPPGGNEVVAQRLSRGNTMKNGKQNGIDQSGGDGGTNECVACGASLEPQNLCVGCGAVLETHDETGGNKPENQGNGGEQDQCCCDQAVSQHVHPGDGQNKTAPKQNGGNGNRKSTTIRLSGGGGNPTPDQCTCGKPTETNGDKSGGENPCGGEEKPKKKKCSGKNKSADQSNGGNKSAANGCSGGDKPPGNGGDKSKENECCPGNGSNGEEKPKKKCKKKKEQDQNGGCCGGDKPPGNGSNGGDKPKENECCPGNGANGGEKPKKKCSKKKKEQDQNGGCCGGDTPPENGNGQGGKPEKIVTNGEASCCAEEKPKKKCKKKKVEQPDPANAPQLVNPCCFALAKDASKGNLESQANGDATESDGCPVHGEQNQRKSQVAQGNGGVCKSCGSPMKEKPEQSVPPPPEESENKCCPVHGSEQNGAASKQNECSPEQDDDDEDCEEDGADDEDCEGEEDEEDCEEEEDEEDCEGEEDEEDCEEGEGEGEDDEDCEEEGEEDTEDACPQETNPCCPVHGTENQAASPPADANEQKDQRPSQLGTPISLQHTCGKQSTTGVAGGNMPQAAGEAGTQIAQNDPGSVLSGGMRVSKSGGPGRDMPGSTTEVNVRPKQENNGVPEMLDRVASAGAKTESHGIIHNGNHEKPRASAGGVKTPCKQKEGPPPKQPTSCLEEPKKKGK